LRGEIRNLRARWPVPTSSFATAGTRTPSRRAITVDDPDAYSRPFTLRYTAELIPNGELMEYICDNEQDAANIDAPADAAIDAAKLLGQ
jgi:hypothetical protein